MHKKHIFIMKPNLKDTKIETMIVSTMQGYHYEIKYTKYSRHAIKIAKKCHNCRIYAVGGDGFAGDAGCRGFSKFSFEYYSGSL